VVAAGRTEPGAAAVPEPEPAPTVPELSPKAVAVAASATGEDLPAPTVAEARASVADAPPTVGEAGDYAQTAGSLSWEPGQLVLGLYEVVGLLGQGGMGRVYRVRHRGWQLDLALKVPLATVLEATGGADLFEREAETWVNLGLHPHVVACHYVRRVAGLPLLFAELADAGSLHEAIRARRFDSLEALLDVAIQFAWGLHHAHEQGLVHRDVKPANVMLTSSGLVKVTDFGLSRARGGPQGAGPGGAAGESVAAGGGGTLAYLSPEHARGEKTDRRSDLWAFALSVLETFLGGRTWESGLVAPEVLDAYRRDGLVAGGHPTMPEPVAELLARCFRERPQDRPRDLAGVAAELREAWEAAAGRRYPRREPRGGSGTADALNNRAASLVDLGRAVEAGSVWRHALASEPHHVEATFNASLAVWLEARLADPEILRLMGEACSSHASSARAMQLLGRLHLAMAQPADALAAFQRAAALGRPDDLERDLMAAQAPARTHPRTLRGLTGTVAALTATPDGRTILAGSGGELRAWDAVGGQLLRTFAVPDGPLRAALALPDGRSLLLSTENAALAVWDLASGRPLRSFTRHAGHATSLALVPGGALVLAGGSDRVVRLWDVASGRVVLELPGHADAVTAVAAGERLAASGARDGELRVWALHDGRCLGTLRAHRGRVHALALAEGHARLFSAGEDAVVNEWSLQPLELARGYVSHAQGATALALAGGRSRVLTGSADRTLRGFDTAAGRLVSLTRLDAAVQAILPTATGTIWVAHGTTVSGLSEPPLAAPPTVLCRPASASEEEDRATAFGIGVGEARRSLAQGDLAAAVRIARAARAIPGHDRAETVLALWDELCARLPHDTLLSAWEDRRYDGHADQVLAVAIDAAGGRLLTGGVDGSARLFAIAAREAGLVLRGHEAAVTGVAFASGGARILTCGRDRTLRLWDASDGRAEAVLEGHAETVAGIDVAPDGLRAASAGFDGVVRTWDLRRGTAVHVLEGHGAIVSAVRFSSDGQVLASAGWDGRVRLWDPESGGSLGLLSGHEGNVTALAVHPHGRQIASGGEDRTVRLFDPRTKRELRAFAGHDAEVTSLAFTPDGRFLLSGSRDRSVRAWDLRRGDLARALPHPAMVLALALAPGASRLVTAGADGAVRAWHLDWEPEAAAATTASEVATTAALGGATARARVAAAAATTRVATLRDDLRRAAPLPVPVLPQAAVAVRQVPWRWVGLGAALLALVAASVWLGRPRTPRVRLSRYMATAVQTEIDLVDPAPFLGDCSPGDYERHIEALRTGHPSARDVACIAARSDEPMVVTDVLDGAPLKHADGLTAVRLRRNAASALASVRGDGTREVCSRLGDARDEVRATAAIALGVTPDKAAGDCLLEAVASGSGRAKVGAGAALRQRLARGLMPAADGWPLLLKLLSDTEAEVREAGLTLAMLYPADLSDSMVAPLLQDADPAVADAAQRAREAIDRIRSADQLGGDTGR